MSGAVIDSTYGGWLGSAAPAPTIISLSKAYGSTGASQSIVITGTGYLGTETITINGSACTRTGATSTTLTVTIPAGVTRGIGNVVVSNANGTATLTGGYFALAMTGWMDPNSGVTQSGGLVSKVTDKAGTTTAFASDWVAPSGAQMNYNASAFGGGSRVGLDNISTESGLDGGISLPFGSGAGAKYGSVLWIGKISSGTQRHYAALTTNESDDFDLAIDSTGSGKVHWDVNSYTGAPAESSTTYNDNVLRTYMGTYDATLASANVKLIINGSTIVTANNTAAFSANGHHVGINAYFNTASAIEISYSLVGIVAEVIYEAAAWSPAEIAFLTNKTAVGSPAYLAGVP